MERIERGNHAVEVLDVLPVHDQVYGECDVTIADLTFADPTGQFDLVRVGARSGDPVGWPFARVLKAELDVVKARFHKLGQTLARKPDSRGDQVRIQTRLPCTLDEFGQIGTRQRLASSEVKMKNAQRGPLPENAQPGGGRKLLFARFQLQRSRVWQPVQ